MPASSCDPNTGRGLGSGDRCQKGQVRKDLLILTHALALGYRMRNQYIILILAHGLSSWTHTWSMGSLPLCSPPLAIVFWVWVVGIVGSRDVVYIVEYVRRPPHFRRCLPRLATFRFVRANMLPLV